MSVSGGLDMIELSKDNSESSIRDLGFRIAGWFSICMVISLIFLISCWIVARIDPSLKSVLLYMIYSPLSLFRWICMVYILIQFKRLLNERYDFYKADMIIKIQIVVSIIYGVEDILMNNIEALFPLSGFAGGFNDVFSIFYLLVSGIVGIFMGVSLLAIREDPYGSLRLYAIISIITSSFLVTILLVPIASLLFLLQSVILGMIFLKAAEAEAQVEFV